MQLTVENCVAEANKFIATISEYPRDKYAGRGIVVCGGGPVYWPCAWVCLNSIRKYGGELGRTLPIQIWSLPGEHVDHELLKRLNVEHRVCHDSGHGYMLKVNAIINCPFEWVLYLDADNFVCESMDNWWGYEGEFKAWADLWAYSKSDKVWDIFGLTPRDCLQYETGQISVNKCQMWRTLMLWQWYNRNAEFFYQWSLGDKDTFQMSVMKFWTGETDYKPAPPKLIRSGMVHFDTHRNRILQHRARAKWRIGGGCRYRDPDFLYEDQAYEWLENIH
jgi:Mannosyltransferase putative